MQPEFENPIRTVTIGHYGEGSGLHYVCIDPKGTDDLNRVLSHADPRCKDECISLLDERLDEEFLHISSPAYSDNPVIGDPSVGLHATTMTQLYGHNEDNFGFDSPEPEPASESELSPGRPYHGLPDEILDKIVRYAVESDLTLIGLFNRVDEKFKTIVSRYYPRIYVNPYLLEKLSFHLHAI